MNTEVQQADRLDKYTLIALVVGLVIYPLLYSTDFFSTVFLQYFPDQFLASLYDDDKRTEWWYFIFSNLVFHLVPFLCIWMALIKNNETWASVGVDWNWFVKKKRWVIAVFTVLIVAAVVLPQIYYGDEPVLRSQAGFIGPISTLERLFTILVLAFTAAITEEVIFRGYALTRLKRWIPNPWLILPLIAISFVFIHGEIRSIGQTLNYIGFSVAFGAGFIFCKFKRLELLIVVHFMINASLVFVP